MINPHPPGITYEIFSLSQFVSLYLIAHLLSEIIFISFTDKIQDDGVRGGDRVTQLQPRHQERVHLRPAEGQRQQEGGDRVPGQSVAEVKQRRQVRFNFKNTILPNAIYQYQDHGERNDVSESQTIQKKGR